MAKQNKKGQKPFTKAKDVKPVAKKEPKKQVTGDWLYFCPQEVGVQELYEAVCDTFETEIWEDAGILEIIMGEKSSLDMESATIHPKDEITADFASTQGAKCVFLATFAPEDYETAEKIMKLFLGQFGGIFCGDTEDFTPQVRA